MKYLVLVTDTRDGKKFAHGKNNKEYYNSSVVNNGVISEWVKEGAYSRRQDALRVLNSIRTHLYNYEKAELLEV